MATLAEVRTRVRTWLEDSGASPLWSDDELDDGLADELAAYDIREPKQQTATITAAAGDTTLPLPDDIYPSGQGDGAAYRLIDPNGFVLMRRAASPLGYVADEEQSWEPWDDTLYLSRQATAGDYTLWYRATRAFPASDDTDFPVPATDLPIIIAGAVRWALELRAREEWKRGPLPPRYQERLDAARRDYQDLLAARRRRVRTTTVEVSG